MLGGISHVAVHDAHKSVMAALPPLEKKRRLVTIEENVAYLNSETQGVIWMARDADSGEILSFRCSVSRSPQDGKKFIDSVLAVCTDRPLLRVGRGPNFPHSLRSLDLYFQIDTIGDAYQAEDQQLLLRRLGTEEVGTGLPLKRGHPFRFWILVPSALRPGPQRDRPEEHHAGGHALSNTTLIALVLAVAMSPSLPHLE